MCKAENRHGIAVSYTSDVTVTQSMPNLVACKDKASQQLVSRGIIAACRGKWKGSVKKSSKQLCAKGWRVCGLRNRNILNKLTWAETVSLPGCYAYDAATSDHFACNRCSSRLKGNSMSGIGAGCGSLERSKTSCLNKGRIGVWNKLRGNSTDEFDVAVSNNFDVPSKTLSSCRYYKGVTTGIMCCKKKSNKRRKVPVCNPGCENGGVCKVGNVCQCPVGRSGYRCEVLNVALGRRCKTPCGPNSHCSRKGICKCDKGFKSTGDTCVARNSKKKGRCRGIVCQNGGRCRRGKCICAARFSGQRCEQQTLTQHSSHCTDRNVTITFVKS
uniref:EGF-like domain-containing protein n=1 Tax=Ciona savignyi TaxID=51511 RepID=H2YB17_CIOSA